MFTYILCLIKDWGVTGYYNAMVLSVEETDNSGTDALKVHIFLGVQH